MTDEEIERAAWRDVGAERGGDKMSYAMTNHDRQIFIRGARVARESCRNDQKYLIDVLHLMLKQFTKTPSTLADSEARCKAHSAIKKATEN